MPRLTLYRQARVDGRVRSGIEVDDGRVWESFSESKEEEDPTLLWYIDVRCKGNRLPRDPQEARDWFLQMAQLVNGQLVAAADTLQVGIDADFVPYMGPITKARDGSSIQVVVSVTRRLSGIEH
jgi:hypothetical protein